MISICFLLLATNPNISSVSRYLASPGPERNLPINQTFNRKIPSHRSLFYRPELSHDPRLVRDVDSFIFERWGPSVLLGEQHAFSLLRTLGPLDNSKRTWFAKLFSRLNRLGMLIESNLVAQRFNLSHLKCFLAKFLYSWYSTY